MQLTDAVLAMKPRRKLDLWKMEEDLPEMPLTIVGYGTFIKVNHVGALIWEMCTGEATVAGIIEAVLERYPDAESATAAADVVEFLGEFDSKALLVLDYDPLES